MIVIRIIRVKNGDNKETRQEGNHPVAAPNVRATVKSLVQSPV